MKKLHFIFAILLISSSVFAQPFIEVQDTIWENTTWSADTVKVTGDIVVVDSALLTILPGTYVEFQGFFSITVNGFLQAIGAETDSITFTVKDTTDYSASSSAGGAWDGLDIKPAFQWNGDTIKMDYCIFEFTKCPTGVTSLQSTIRTRNDCILKVSNSRFKNNWKATVVFSEKAMVYRCHYHNNTGYILRSPSLVRNCEFNSNFGTAVYLLGDDWTVQIICNHIHNNQSYQGGAIRVGWMEYVEIIGNLINNNTASDDGGGIFVEGSHIIIANNTICNNEADKGGAIFVRYNSTSKIFSNIIFNNSATLPGDQIALEANSHPTITDCILEGGINSINTSQNPGYNGQHSNILDVDPLFLNPVTGVGSGFYSSVNDWSLFTSSAAVNSGRLSVPGLPLLDLAGQSRISYRQIDMGALEYYMESIECGYSDEPLSSSVSSNQRWIADTIKVNGGIQVASGAILTIGPGTYVEFQDNEPFEVEGTLIIEGFSDKKTVLAAKDPTEGWGGIETGSDIAEDSIIISNAHIKDVPNGYEAIFISGYKLLRIEYTDFSNNHDCIKVENTNVEINSCRFFDNKFEELIAVDYGDVSIRNCSFFDNYCDEDPYSILIVEGGSLELISTVIMNNNCYGVGWEGDGAHLIWHTGLHFLMNNCLITNNIDTADHPIMIEPIITAKIINSTIVNNLHKGASESVYIASDYSTSVAGITNSILTGNRFGSGLNQSQLYLAGNYESKVLNSVIEGGVDSIRLGPGESGFVYEHIYDTDPLFRLALTEPGIYTSEEPFDYSLTNFSPLINKGRSDLPDLLVADYDLAGNPRVYPDEVDIGAYENQAGVPEISGQLSNLFLCDGEKAEFQIETNDTAIFRWFKDGELLPGDTLSSMVIDSVTELDEGNYHYELENGFGKVVSNQAYMLVRQPPGILVQPADQWVTPGDNILLKSIVTGSEPVTYKWYYDDKLLTGVFAPEYSIIAADSSIEGTYKLELSNICGSAESAPANLYLAPELCMVTVDPATGNNLVIWEKSSKAPVDYYNIYREGQKAGIYDKLGTVAHEDLSILVDETADPTVQAYLYKITAVDTSGYETDIDLCEPHKTIHLVVSTNPELKTTQLQWDRYYGFEYSTYNILRSATGSGFLPVHFLASSLASWTDPDPLPETGFYRISVDKPIPCFPAGAGKKADSGPYSHSLSNVEDNRLQAGESPPDTIFLTNSAIKSNNRFGDLVGRLIAVDADSLDSHTWSLVVGEGDEDNMSFTILGDLLLAAEIFDYEDQDEYSIRVRCKDEGNLSREQVFTIHIWGPTGNATMTTRQVAIYPNPFSHSTMIEFANPDKAKYRMYITDLAGKVVRFEDNIYSDKLEITRENLKEGVYFVELRGNKIYRGKLVVE